MKANVIIYLVQQKTLCFDRSIHLDVIFNSDVSSVGHFGDGRGLLKICGSQGLDLDNQ